MNLRTRSLLVLAATAACALPVAAYVAREDPAPAEETAAARKERKVRRMLAAMKQRESMEAATKASSESFGKMGLPESFTEAFLDRFDYDRMIDATADVYVDELEEGTIDALIAFHESEQGQLHAAALPRITVATLRAGQKYGEELATEIASGK